MTDKKSQAPSAHQYFKFRDKNKKSMNHGKYMDFAESYADFIIEFEKNGGDLKRCFPTIAFGVKY